MEQLRIDPNCQYDLYVPRWQRVRDILDGEARLKERDLAAIGKWAYSGVSHGVMQALRVRYLRPLTPSDTSQYNLIRNQQYIMGARLFNATVRTLTGLMGMAYRVEPTPPELPDEIAYIIDDVDGTGLSMDQQSQAVTRDVLAIGRDGLLADMPRNDDGQPKTKADVNRGFRATIQEYKAESIIDWHESVDGGVKKLDLLVLLEQVECFCDEYRIRRELKDQYKVYRLVDGYVTVQIFTDGDEGLEESDQVDVMDGFGNLMTEIPFRFVGSINNQPSIDALPMEPLANINIGHYQESANLSSSSFNLSAAQPVISDDRYQQAQRDPKADQVQNFGEAVCLVLGSGGKFEIVAPPENSLATGMMKGYEEQMVALGAQLITNSSGNETAEAAKIKHSSDVSVLDTVANNVSDAYSDMLRFVAEFMGVRYDDSWRYELNRSFFDTSLTAQDIDAMVRLWQAGGISKYVLDSKLKSAKIIGQDVDLDEMNEEIKEQAINQGGVNFDEEEPSSNTPTNSESLDPNAEE